MQQLESRWAAAALVMAQAGAGFTGSVAGLTAAHLCVAVGARPTFPHAAATPEEEALFTPVTPILVTDVTVGSARFAFRFFSVGLLRAGFVAVMFKHVIPRNA